MRRSPPRGPDEDVGSNTDSHVGADEEGTVSFEEGLERLEMLVARLEGGDLELEEALEVFERGVALTRQCSSRLEAAERRIEVLVQEGRHRETRPLENLPDDEERDD